MASKSTARIPLRSSTEARPDPEVERRLRAAFPDVWARYEWLRAARALIRRQRKTS